MRRRLRTATFALAMFAPALGYSGNAFAASHSVHHAAAVRYSAAVNPPASASANEGEADAQASEQAPKDSQLPLLSILGMGLLTGGLLSALRTRPR